jgi:signal transduction histidine kinase
MKPPLTVLIVEDSADDVALLVKELQKHGFDLKWRCVDTEADYREHLTSGIHMIFSDFAMPRFSTARGLELLQESKLDIPFIIVSGTIGEERAVESMKAGATDYVLKDNLQRLFPVVKRALLEVQERAECRQAEAQFVEAQKMEIIGQLSAGIAHDFNNMLGVIIGYSELAALESDPEVTKRKYIVEIRNAADRAAALTRQLLVFSRRQTVQLVVLDLNEVLKDLDRMLRRLIDENVELTIAPAKRIGRIKADSGQVGQVLMNLVVNARDAMPEGGKLRIETADIALDEAFTRAHGNANPGEYVMLAVSDSGTGMTAEVKAHLFEAFFTTKPKGKGTGLGLATCRTIISHSDGCIDVQSELGHGTTFKIYFPRVDLPLETMEQAAKAEPLVRGTETLLLVEDEPSVRHLARSILEAQGYNVLTASNGQEGLRVAHDCKGEPIRLVITDVIMPLMSGRVMAEWLRAVYPDLLVLFTSGYTDDAIVEPGMLEPGIAFLPKPYTPDALGQKVRELLDAAP